MRSTITGLALVGAMTAVVVYPALTYKVGTSENVTVSVLSEPFGDGDALVYRWSGDVTKSCPVTIRRTFIDADNVVTTLTASSFGAIPSSALGHADYEITVNVPRQIAEGPAVYRAVEVPQCSWMQRFWPVAAPYPDVHFTVTR